MRIVESLDKIGYTLLQGNLNAEAKEVVYDSRKAGENAVFVCINKDRLS